jgi:5'-3' exonuclease
MNLSKSSELKIIQKTQKSSVELQLFLFKVDLNGKKRDYLGVVLLPFIDQQALLSAIEPIKDELTEEEKQRNSPHQNHIFVHSSNRKLFDELMKLNDEDKIVELKEDVMDSLKIILSVVFHPEITLILFLLITQNSHLHCWKESIFKRISCQNMKM